MPTLRQLRDRVRSLKNTQQITRAMKMVAGAKIRRAELDMRAARPYAAAIGDTLNKLGQSAGAGLNHPLMQAREVRTRGLLLMTADKGLCGAFNSNLVRAASNELGGDAAARLYLVGIKGRVQLKRTPNPVAAAWPLGSKHFRELAREIAHKITEDFTSGAVDQVALVSSRFVSTLVQRPTTTRLLPIAAAGAGERDPGKNAFEFEPDVGAVLAALLPKYLEFTIFQALLETQASEFAARLIAMTNATDNAGKLIDEITLAMNKTRQASITKEILEIVGGAEALKG
ncbi:MAG: ATP synthase F1 subunit gamma [Candidatus Eremiobacteraeota bacterium]|nr:ATP synthase F1 subunit gamma [Candidatus Eremiobacteraeota bacterium]MBV8281298.1 ATP synthase F1 subunit gamma [Candidatus Eremiobacteraeota bacterium]